MVGHFKNQCSAFNVNGKRCRMKSMNETEQCYFHNKKKKEECDEVFSEDDSRYSHDMINRITILELNILQLSEENEVHRVKITRYIDQIAKIQRALILVHFMLYAYIIHAITYNNTDYNIITDLWMDYQWFRNVISTIKTYVMFIAKYWNDYLFANKSNLLEETDLSMEYDNNDEYLLHLDYIEYFQFNQSDY